MAATSSIPVAWLQARECQQVIPRVRQARIMPCMRSKPSVSPARMLRTSFQRPHLFNSRGLPKNPLWASDLLAISAAPVHIGLASLREPRYGSLNSVAAL